MSEKIEKVSDDQLIESIDRYVRNSDGGFFPGTSDVAKRRENSIYEMSLEARGDLAPQGVSKIVASDSAEIAEGYTALIVKLLLDNNKLAMFTPYDDSVSSIKNAQFAIDLVNYCLFNSNSDGWSKLSTWIKSAVVLGNSALTWGWEEDYDYEIEEYETIDEVSLDQILADPDLEIIGDLSIDEENSNGEDQTIVYSNVRLRRKIDKSRVKLRNVAPEAFIIDRSATSIHDAKFVGIVTEMTRSDIRKNWKDFEGDISDLGEEIYGADFDIGNFARKDAAGISTWDVNSQSEEEEANIEVTVIECWIKSDRDGDGIAELKHVIKAGNVILEEDDVSYIPIAVLNPIEIPHEFYGLSLLDMARSQTQATTAILRGFVENVYFGNYGRTLADPNVVDFAALQNPLPKQIIATNGNPTAAIQQIQPEPISSGTTGMLEFLGLQKEQSTGLTKTALGLNDTLYVSGNSETKMAGAQNAAQTRIEHIARRFVESGIKDLCRGVLREMKNNLKNPLRFRQGKGYSSVTAEELQRIPANMDLDIQANLGENSNMNVSAKLNQLAELLPMMAQDATASSYVSPMASFNLATDIIENMGMDPTRFLLDPEDPNNQQMIQQQQQSATERANAERDLEIGTKQANINLIKAEVDNKKIDNKRQLLQAEDESNRKWAEVAVKAAKDGVPMPEKVPVDFQSLYQDTDADEKQQQQEQAMMQQMQQQMAQQGTMEGQQPVGPDLNSLMTNE